MALANFFLEMKDILYIIYIIFVIRFARELKARFKALILHFLFLYIFLSQGVLWWSKIWVWETSFNFIIFKLTFVRRLI